jgi:hypothetical protein
MTELTRDVQRGKRRFPQLRGFTLLSGKIFFRAGGENKS